jgi:hypothetical protein
LAVDPARFHFFDADSGLSLLSQVEELDKVASSVAG